METPNAPTVKSKNQRTPDRKVWKCGDPDGDRYTVPAFDGGNPWKTCLEPLLEEDRIKCEQWEDEVQSLLLFAELFSAVVTAFVVQSYQALQANDNQMSIALLTTIVEQLSRLANGTSVPTSIVQIYPNPFYPSSCLIRINIYWFISLILSLMTVLIGIVALQWLREYKRHPSNLSPKRTFAARNLRAEGFDEWFVPQILAGLPLLLQAALILFFIGLIDFLLDLNFFVALPVIVLIGITLLFLLITTILPTLQAFWLLNSNAKKPTSLPPQCPYKSPQSWAFLRLASSSTTRCIVNGFGNIVFNAFLIPLVPIVWAFREYLQVSCKLKLLGTLQSWTQFDGLWMDERHRIITESSEPRKYFTNLVGTTDYDAARGIARVIDGHTHDESLAFAVYHCFQQLPQVVITDDIFKLMAQSLPGWMTSHQPTRKATMLGRPSVNMTREENEMFLLSHLPQTTVMSPIHMFGLRQLELFVRTSAYIFTGDHVLDNPEVGYDLAIDSPLQIRGKMGRLLIPDCIKSTRGMNQLPNLLAADLREQLSMVFRSFVTRMLSVHTSRYSRVLHSEEMLDDFMQVMHTITLSTIASTSMTSPPSSLQHMATLSNLTDTIESLNHSLLFFASLSIKSTFSIAALYVSCFHYTEWAPICHRAPILSAALKELITTLRLIEQTSKKKVSYRTHHYYYRRQWAELVNVVLPMEQLGNLDDLDSHRAHRIDVYATSSMGGTISDFVGLVPPVQMPSPAKLRFHVHSDLHEGTILPNSLV